MSDAKEFVGQERVLAALKLLTGPGLESINDAAARRLKELAVGLKDFAAPAHNGAAEAKG